jgi:hypothetical protein
MCCVCCWEVRGEVGGAGGRRWRVRKEARALRAEGEEFGVWGEMEGWVGEAGAVEEGVM